LYYGDEIGMENNDPKSKDEVQTPSEAGWPLEKGRDGDGTPCNGPMAQNAGLKQSETVAAVPPPSTTIQNVASEMKDQNSVLSFYRHCWRYGTRNQRCSEGEYLAPQ